MSREEQELAIGRLVLNLKDAKARLTAMKSGVTETAKLFREISEALHQFTQDPLLRNQTSIPVCVHLKALVNSLPERDVLLRRVDEMRAEAETVAQLQAQVDSL
jgi:hypothetical protein